MYAIASCTAPVMRYEHAMFGLWRSLVARPSGGRKVAGSSPASPTTEFSKRSYPIGCGRFVFNAAARYAAPMATMPEDVS
jgi:hypothetical protein